MTPAQTVIAAQLARDKLKIALARFANRHVDGESGSSRRRECVETHNLLADVLILLAPDDAHPVDRDAAYAEINAALARVDRTQNLTT